MRFSRAFSDSRGARRDESAAGEGTDAMGGGTLSRRRASRPRTPPPARASSVPPPVGGRASSCSTRVCISFIRRSTFSSAAPPRPPTCVPLRVSCSTRRVRQGRASVRCKGHHTTHLGFCSSELLLERSDLLSLMLQHLRLAAAPSARGGLVAASAGRLPPHVPCSPRAVFACRPEHCPTRRRKEPWSARIGGRTPPCCSSAGALLRPDRRRQRILRLHVVGGELPGQVLVVQRLLLILFLHACSITTFACVHTYFPRSRTMRATSRAGRSARRAAHTASAAARGGARWGAARGHADLTRIEGGGADEHRDEHEHQAAVGNPTPPPSHGRRGPLGGGVARQARLPLTVSHARLFSAVAAADTHQSIAALGRAFTNPSPSLGAMPGVSATD